MILQLLRDHELITTLCILIVCIGGKRSVERYALRNKFHEELCRKSIHVGIGLLYVACWSLYRSDCEMCKYYASSLSMLLTIKFCLIALGVVQDGETVKILCRGQPRISLLRGPLLYGLVLSSLSIYFWLDNPLGIIGIMNLIAGDGMAAVGGTFLPLARLPWNKAKSIGGLLSYWISAWVTSAVFLWWFQTLGYFPKLTGAWIIAVVLAGFFGGVVESFPLGALDNFCVPAVSMFVANYLSCKSL